MIEKRLICLFFLSALIIAQPSHVGWAQVGVAPDVGVRFRPPTTVALVGGTIVTAPGAEPKVGTIIIAEEKIQAIGHDVTVPAGVEIISCEGKFLYPAFIDACVDWPTNTTELAGAYWNSNIHPEYELHVGLKADDAKFAALRDAGIGIAALVPNSGLMAGQSCVVSVDTSNWSKSLLVPSLFQHMQLYPDRRSRDYPNSPMGAVALVRQALWDADWYARACQAVASDPSLESPEYNAALAALATTLRGQQTVVINGANEQYAMRADRIAREFSLKLIIRGSGREYRRLDDIVSTNRTIIIPVAFPATPDVATAEAVVDTTLQSLMHWRLAPENPARLSEAGVNFVISSMGLDKPSELVGSVRKAIEHGLDSKIALAALTTRPAKLLGIEAQVGTLETGKFANLIITKGELFSKDSKIEETWVRGERFGEDSGLDENVAGIWEIAFQDSTLGRLDFQISGQASSLKGKLGEPGSFDKVASKKDEASGENVSDATASKDDPEVDPKTQASSEGAQPADADVTQEDIAADESERVKDSKGEAAAKLVQVDLKELSFDGFRLDSSFDATELSKLDGFADLLAGTTWVSAALVSGDETPKLHGFILSSGGKRIPFSAERRPAERKDEPSKRESSVAEDRVELEVNYPLGAYGRRQPPELVPNVLIRGATIWTCGPAGILENADMLVCDGKIKAVGKGLEIPEGALVVDGQGMHLTPGIIDCHSHMATDGGVNESGQAVTAEVRIGDFIDPTDITIYRQLAGGVTTANILHGSANPIGGQNQVIKLRWGAMDDELKMKEAPAGIKFALGENVKQSNWSEPTGRYPQSRMGVEQIMVDRFDAAMEYRQRWQAWSRQPSGLPPRRDLELDALGEILAGERWVHCHSYRQDEILTVLRTLERFHIQIGTLQHILEGYKVAEAIAAHGATASSFSDWWTYKLEVVDAIPYNGALMHKSGIVVSFNSDDAELARHLNHEAAKAVKYGGVEPSEALKFVTLNPAKQLRIDPYVGSLEPGKHADFVLWNRSPLSALSMCMQTWIDGRKYFDRQESTAQHEADMELHRKLVQAAQKSGGKTQRGADQSDPSYWWVRFDEFCGHNHEGHDHMVDHYDAQAK
ncbi:MAG: amidohydrolase family protein [Planctomycetales bacterium]|nr:amidohydrolase family protein [Planctomycetales bacterium]